MLLDAGGISLKRHCVVMAWFPCELTDVVVCCTHHSRQTWDQGHYTRWKGTVSISNKPRVRTEADDLYDRMLDPIASGPATGKSVVGIINLFVDNLFRTGGTEMEKHVLARLRKDFQVGSEDWNDVTFTVQRIRWVKDQSKSCIEVSQQK